MNESPFPFRSAHPHSPNNDLIREHCLWLAGGMAPRSIQSAYELLGRVDTDLHKGLAEALPQELAAWLAGIHRHPHAPPWSRSTRATYRAHIIRFYQWACDPDDPVLDYDPSARLLRPKVSAGVPDPASDAQVQACITTLNQPWQLHTVLAAYAGLRPCEIAALRREDVTETHIRIRDGKGGKVATLPVEPPVWRAVRDLPRGAVTRKVNGQPATYSWVSMSTAAAMRRAGINTTLRHLRHWHATHLRQHHDVFVVQQRMRHSNVRTTQGYAAVLPGELAASVGTLPDFTDGGQ